MFRIIFCIVLLVFSIGLTSVAKDDEPVYSTQGIEIDGDAVQKSKPTSESKNEQKRKENRSKKYIKYKKELTKQEVVRAKNQKELEYLEKRLEGKQNKLNSLTSDHMKGE